MAPHRPCHFRLGLFFMGLLEMSNGFLSAPAPAFLSPSFNVQGLGRFSSLPPPLGLSASPSWKARSSLVGLSMKGKGAAKKKDSPSPPPPLVSTDIMQLAESAEVHKSPESPVTLSQKEAAKSQESSTNATTKFVLRHLPAEWLRVDFDECLGAGGYGDTYEATIIGGPLKGTRAVAKRSLDGHRSGDTRLKSTTDAIELDEATRIEKSKQIRKNETSAQRFLRVEAIINQIVAKECPQIEASRTGEWAQHRALVLILYGGNRYEGDTTLQDLFARADEEDSIGCFASALGVDVTQEPEGGFESEEDRAASVLGRVATALAQELLGLLEVLGGEGIAHRDVKPQNVLVRGGVGAGGHDEGGKEGEGEGVGEKLKLIDFGAAAGMGLRWKVGYDRERAPCDEKYHAPEEFLHEEAWQAFDVYSVGLVLVRLLFRPLWSTAVFSSFLAEFREAKSSLDAQLPTDRAERVLARSSKVNKPVFTTMHRRGGEAPDVSRGREYLELAGEQCEVEFEDEEEEEEESPGAKKGEEEEEEEEEEEQYHHNMRLCLFREGLLALERASSGVANGEGLTWATLRGILAKEPTNRLLPEAGVREEIKKLKAEHREVNEETDILCMGDTSNAMISYRLQDLKKRKLLLKDKIASLESLLASNRPSKQ